MDLLLPTRNHQEKERKWGVLGRDKEEEETNVEKRLKGGRRKTRRNAKTGLTDEDGDHGRGPTYIPK